MGAHVVLRRFGRASGSNSAMRGLHGSCVVNDSACDDTACPAAELSGAPEPLELDGALVRGARALARIDRARDRLYLALFSSNVDQVNRAVYWAAAWARAVGK